MDNTRILLLLVVPLIMLGCQEEARQTVIAPSMAEGCQPPLIIDGESCCLDRDADGLCDTEEAGPAPLAGQEEKSEAVQKTTAAIPIEGTAAKAGIARDASNEEERKDIGLFSSLVPFSADSAFLSPMEEEKTVIAFDAGKTTGSMVLSALNLKLYLDNPSDLDVFDHVAGFTEAEKKRLLESHVILLGNGCTNSMIAEILGLSGDACHGTVKGTGKLMFYAQAGKRVMLVIGYDDEDVYAMEKKIVAGEVEFQGKEMTVTI